MSNDFLDFGRNVIPVRVRVARSSEFSMRVGRGVSGPAIVCYFPMKSVYDDYREMQRSLQ